MLTIENAVLLVIDFQERMVPAIYCYNEMVAKSAVIIKGCRVLVTVK